MIGSFLTRGLVMIFGYAYPAYECYKTVEKNRPEIEQLRFWCQYWILVAVLTVFERLGDIFISWVPMYSEAKLAFFIYLWYPKTRGTTYVYDSFFKPYLAKHETEIDRNLLELRARAGDIAVLYWRQAITYGQTRIFEVLQYVSAQSTTRPRPTQPQEQHAGAAAEPPPTAQTQQPATTSRAKPQKQPADASNASSTSQQSRTSTADANTQEQHQTEQEVDSAAAAPPPPVSPKPAATHPQTKVPNLLTKKAASAQILAEAMQIDSPTSSSASESTNPPSQETVMEETIRVTRGRLRKTRASLSIH